MKLKHHLDCEQQIQQLETFIKSQKELIETLSKKQTKVNQWNHYYTQYQSYFKRHYRTIKPNLPQKNLEKYIQDKIIIKIDQVIQNIDNSIEKSLNQSGKSSIMGDIQIQQYEIVLVSQKIAKINKQQSDVKKQIAQLEEQLGLKESIKLQVNNNIQNTKV